MREMDLGILAIHGIAQLIINKITEEEILGGLESKLALIVAQTI